MREIKYIVLHCTATPQNATVKSIQNYWSNSLGWKNPGYHYIISADGAIHNLADHQTVCNGVAGFNANALHISYIGGVDAQNKPLDNRTDQQKHTMLTILKIMRAMYPAAVFMGHRDFPNVAKACPCFNVKEFVIKFILNQTG